MFTIFTELDIDFQQFFHKQEFDAVRVYCIGKVIYMAPAEPGCVVQGARKNHCFDLGV